jgi:predicted dithiol-disulfide oxidoreductase (DUF899 family)
MRPMASDEAGPANHRTVAPDQWLAERTALLVREKALTRLRDELAAARRALPWVEVGPAYVFDGADGAETLPELFAGRSQLVVYHFMFDPQWDAGCPQCSHFADSFAGAIVHLSQRDVTMIAVSQAPYPKLAQYRRRMGWTFKWVSSHGSTFNRDFHVAFTPAELAAGRGFYNFTMQNPGDSQREGLSVFCRDAAGAVFHTYSTYARGIDALSVDYQVLDLTPKGRDEGGRGPFWVRRHDEYDR